MITLQVTYSKDVRRPCYCCGAKRFISKLEQFGVVKVGQPLVWRCVGSCLKKQATLSRAVATTVRAPIHDR